MSKRESGYYWVRLRDDEYSLGWTVALYKKSILKYHEGKFFWWLVADFHKLTDNDLAEIGPRILPPEDVKQEDVVSQPGLFDA